ncbi:MAG: DNA repair protein RecO [Firmicutes bacterium ADurb.Bin193]|nr:MAG: DNA repair protein RecO [Firmicutes bacterium ADurb.Bin193]
MTTTKGLIIKETKVGEGDKILTILTSELGKIQAGANGARSYKSKLIAGCQLFSYSDFVLTKKKEWYRVSSAEPCETFYNLRLDIKKLSLATYFCDLICEVATDGADGGDILRLALNTLYILTKNDNLPLIKAVFELRLMCVSGFAPSVLSCAVCAGQENLTRFDVSGGVCCESCGGVKISAGTIDALRHVCECDLKKLFSFNVSKAVLDELSSVAENYIVSQTGRSFKSLKYYLTISEKMV